MIDCNAAETAIAAISPDLITGYNDYWATIAPKNTHEVFMRWIFAFLSVHTTWSANVLGFKILNRNTLWFNNDNLLLEHLITSGVGIHTRRLKGISQFTKSFFEDPNSWNKQTDETWIQCRNRLATRCYGLGLAKTAFALEMCYPLENESVCLDTHMLQLYGYKTAKEKAKGMQYDTYIQMETHWVMKCKERSIPAAIARAIVWDKKQLKSDSRYWTYVFENESKDNKSNLKQEV